MSVPASFLSNNGRNAGRAPRLVVTDPALRLVRRGLLDRSDETIARWVGARVFVFRHGPVVYELPAPRVDAPSPAPYVSAVMIS